MLAKALYLVVKKKKKKKKKNKGSSLTSLRRIAFDRGNYSKDNGTLGFASGRRQRQHHQQICRSYSAREEFVANTATTVVATLGKLRQVYIETETKENCNIIRLLQGQQPMASSSSSGRQQEKSIPKWDQGTLPLARLREEAWDSLVKTLDSLSGSKYLVVDGDLQPVLHLLRDNNKRLAEHGIDTENGLLYLRGLTSVPNPLKDTSNIVYVVRPTLKTIHLVAAQIKEMLRGLSQDTNFVVAMVPRITLMSQTVFEEWGIRGDVVLKECKLDMVPFEQDVITLEMPRLVNEVYQQGDPTALYYVASAIMRLQERYGMIPQIKGVGDSAEKVRNVLKRLRGEKDRSQMKQDPPLIDGMILIDRMVDLVSPMCTQLTFEGILDEILGVRYWHPVQTLEFKDPTDPHGRGQVTMNSGDRLYSEIRDMSFFTAAGYCGKRIKELQAGQKSLQQMSIGETKDFVQKLAYKASLEKYINVATLVKPHVTDPLFAERVQLEQGIVAGDSDYTTGLYQMLDEMMVTGADILTVLRLVVLVGWTGDITIKRWTELRSKILQHYGYWHQLTLNALVKAGVIRLQSSRSRFSLLRKNLRLYVEDVNINTPEDIAYVHSCIAPMSVRLVDLAVKGKWSGVKEAMNLLIPQFEIKQSWSDTGKATEEKYPEPFKSAEGRSYTNVLVVFIGGCSYTELSALRFLQEQSNGTVKYIVMTTSVGGGKELLNSFIEEQVQWLVAEGQRLLG
eukprot:TRINITY_DN5420_c0_g1_i5.p1 TRINITY_DN5420_c0_g1~~TRINITY_DN5420_c0_g1_i5.p1  ORF type:complete len:735 (+),score=76.04 TRINITY_DN5420_c0_g1_i5:431-2635(+)